MKITSLALAILLSLSNFCIYAEAKEIPINCETGIPANSDTKITPIDKVIIDEIVEGEQSTDISDLKDKYLTQEKLEEVIKSIASSKKIIISYDRKEIDYDVMPQYVDSKLMIPVRQTLEAMGYKVNWNQEENSVEIVKGTNYYKLYIGDNVYIKNKMAPFSLSEAPILKDNRTLVPLEFFHEVLSLSFEIDSGNINFAKKSDDIEANKLTTHLGFLVKAERQEGFIRYHLSKEKDGEVYLIVTIQDENSFYQQIPVIGESVNIITSSIMLTSYPGQTGGFIVY